MSGNNFAGRWLGGWQFNGIVTLQTGTPFNVTANNDGLVDSNNPVCMRTRIGNLRYARGDNQS